MKQSGYNESFRSKTISEGLRGHVKKQVSSYESGTPFNRSGNIIRENMLRKRKTNQNWFRNNGETNKYDTVLFIPATSGSVLAKSLRQHEEQNAQGRLSRIKIVEKSGKSVLEQLSKSYPWPTEKCSDPSCFPCSTGNRQRFSCRVPGAGYRIVCSLCEEKGSAVIYYGETGHNLYTRGKKHLEEFNQKLSSNCMVIHHNLHHNDISSHFDFYFRMEGEGLFSSAMERQVNESLRIKYSGADTIMNSGSEWRMDPIPRARVAKARRPDILPTNHLIEKTNLSRYSKKYFDPRKSFNVLMQFNLKRANGRN